MSEPRRTVPQEIVARELHDTTAILQQFVQDVAEYTRAHNELRNGLEQLQRAVTQLGKDLRGTNGDPTNSLFYRLSMLEKDVEQATAERKDMREWWWNIAEKVIAALILGAIGAGITIYAWLGKLPPKP